MTDLPRRMLFEWAPLALWDAAGRIDRVGDRLHIARRAGSDRMSGVLRLVGMRFAAAVPARQTASPAPPPPVSG